MSKKTAWAIKTTGNSFVNRPPEFYWEADRTLLFRNKRQAEAWLANNPYWTGRGEVVKVTVIIKEYMS